MLKSVLPAFPCNYHLTILTCKNIKMFCCFSIITWFYYNQIEVTFRLWSRLSSSNQIDLPTHLYCRKVTFEKASTTVNTDVLPYSYFFFFWKYVLTHAHSYLYVNNYFLCRFFNMFVVITMKANQFCQSNRPPVFCHS